jgi:methionyl aminopeptidase
MSLIKTDEEIATLREGGGRLAKILATLVEATKPGITGRELDKLARELIAKGDDQPSFLNYAPEGVEKPFPAALCISINDEVVHGIPDDRILKISDIVGLDLGLSHQGLFTDMAVSVPVGEVSKEVHKLLTATEEGLRAGIEKIRPGNTLGDVGFAIEEVAKSYGLGVVRDLGGHGVGHLVHEEPHIPNFGKRGKGVKLKEGMVLAIEPMFTLGTDEVNFLPDGYMVKTADGSLAAHFEHTVVVTANGAEILTKI